jgi:hypothetical protein
LEKLQEATMRELKPTVRTQITQIDFLTAMQAVDPTLSREACGILWAQSSFETGNFKSMYCNNLGNIKLGNVDEPYFALEGCWEIIQGKKVIIPTSNPGSWFRAFDTLKEGMIFYLGFLKRRYGTAYTAALSGDPTLFVHNLKMHGYFTGDEAAYTRNVVYLYNHFMATTKPGSSIEAPAENPPLPEQDAPIVILPKVDLGKNEDILKDLEETDAPLKLPAKIDLTVIFNVLKAIYEFIMKFKK